MPNHLIYNQLTISHPLGTRDGFIFMCSFSYFVEKAKMQWL